MSARLATISIALWLLGAAANLSAQMMAGPLEVKKGEEVQLELETPLNTATAREGDRVFFKTRSALRAVDGSRIPPGMLVEGVIVSARPVNVNGRDGRAEIRIRLIRLPLADGGYLDARMSDITIKGEVSGNNRSAASIANALLNPGTPFAGLQGMGMARLMGGNRNAQGIAAAAAMGGSVLSQVLAPRGPSSEVDLPPGIVILVKTAQPISIPDPTKLATGTPRDAGTPAPALSASAYGTALPLALMNSMSPAAATTPNGIARSAVPDAPSYSPRPVEAPTEAAGPAPVATPENGASASDAPMTLKVDVSLVQIDAVARSRNGQPMINLRKEDFRIFDDGQEQEIQRFSRDEQPLAVALVIDRSSSVAPQMPQIQAAAHDALRRLKRGDSVCLIGFAQTADLLAPLTTDMYRVASMIGGIRAGGGTAIVDAVHETLRYLARVAPDRRRAVIVISDNQEGASRLRADDTVKLALETETVIYSVQVNPGAMTRTSIFPSIAGIPSLPGTPLFRVNGSAVVDTLTKETGGEIFDVTSPGDLDTALATAVARLRTRYTLGYSPTSPANGGYHRLDVRLADRFGKAGDDYSVLARKGYFDGNRP
jgi:VWFA-related protein